MLPGNVAYRYLLHKLPCRSVMTSIFGSSLGSASCSICAFSNESANHMLFFCPPKQHIWKEIIFEFLWPTFTTQDIIDGVTTLELDQKIGYSKFSGSLSPTLIVFVTMATIWKAHFNTIFHSTPFLADPVLRQT